MDEPTQPHSCVSLCCFPVARRYYRKRKNRPDDTILEELEIKKCYGNSDLNLAATIYDTNEEQFRETDVQVTRIDQDHDDKTSPETSRRVHSPTLSSLDVLFSRVSLSGSMSSNQDGDKTNTENGDPSSKVAQMDPSEEDMPSINITNGNQDNEEADFSEDKEDSSPLHSLEFLPATTRGVQDNCTEFKKQRPQRESVISMISSGYGSFKDSMPSSLSEVCDIPLDDEANNLESDIDTPTSSLASNRESILSEVTSFDPADEGEEISTLIDCGENMSSDMSAAPRNESTNDELTNILRGIKDESDSLKPEELTGRSVRLPNFSATFLTKSGGKISIPGTRISLYVPPGALATTDDKPVLVYIYLTPESKNRSEQLKSNARWLTPNVECGPPGLSFQSDVLLTMPHYAVNPHQWEFNAHQAKPQDSFPKTLENAAVIVNKYEVTFFLNHFCSHGCSGTMTSTSSSGQHQERKWMKAGVMFQRQDDEHLAMTVRLRDIDCFPHLPIETESFPVNESSSKVLVVLKGLDSMWQLDEEPIKDIEVADIWSDSAVPEVTFTAVIGVPSQHRVTDESSIDCTLDVFQHNNDHSGETLQLQMKSSSPANVYDDDISTGIISCLLRLRHTALSINFSSGPDLNMLRAANVISQCKIMRIHLKLAECIKVLSSDVSNTSKTKLDVGDSGQESIQSKPEPSQDEPRDEHGELIPETMHADDIKHKFLLDQPDLKPCDWHSISEEGFCDLCMFLENADCRGHGWKALAERIGITPHPYILNIEHRAIYQKRSPAAIVLDFFFKDTANNPLDALRHLSNICYKIDNLAAKELVDNEILSIQHQIQRRTASVETTACHTSETREETQPAIIPSRKVDESLGVAGALMKPVESEQHRKSSLRTSLLITTFQKKFVSSMKRGKGKSKSGGTANKITEERPEDSNSGQFNEAFETDLGRSFGESITNAHIQRVSTKEHSCTSQGAVETNHMTQDNVPPPKIFIISCDSSSEPITGDISQRQGLMIPEEPGFHNDGNRPDRDSGISDTSRLSWRSTCSHGVETMDTTTTSPA